MESLFDAGRIAANADDVSGEQLFGWWLYGMLEGGHPLREKLTLFWHNHFATSIAKVQSPKLMLRQNGLMREYAMGKFGPFLQAMSKDAAMLLWLDSNTNVKGRPNENYARELMELFSLGTGHYTEGDIREAARAFTGWRTDGEGFAFDARSHDGGFKTVLGQTGAWDGVRRGAHRAGSAGSGPLPGPQVLSLLRQRERRSAGLPARAAVRVVSSERL